jgi:hypothetical protein
MMHERKPANVVVYCKTVRVPKGCVARPVGPVVVSPGVGMRPGAPANLVPGTGLAVANLPSGCRQVFSRRQNRIDKRLHGEPTLAATEARHECPIS